MRVRAGDKNEGYYIGRQGQLVHTGFREMGLRGTVFNAYMGQKCMIVLRENKGGISSRILRAEVDTSGRKEGPYVSNGENMAEKKFLIRLTGSDLT